MGLSRSIYAKIVKKGIRLQRKTNCAQTASSQFSGFGILPTLQCPEPSWKISYGYNTEYSIPHISDTMRNRVGQYKRSIILTSCFLFFEPFWQESPDMIAALPYMLVIPWTCGQYNTILIEIGPLSQRFLCLIQ